MIPTDYSFPEILLLLAGIGVSLLLGGGIGYLLASKGKRKKAPSTKAPPPLDSARLMSAKLRKLYAILADLTSSLDYQRVLDKSLDASFIALNIAERPTEDLVSAVLFFAEDGLAPPVLRVATGRGLPRPDQHRKTPGVEGVLGAAIDAGEPELSRELSSDPELSSFIAFQSCQTAYCIPLRVKLDIFGVLLFAHPDVRYFDSAQREILNVVSHQAMTALQNAQLFQELKDEKEHIIKVQEEERTKLSRDLHDGPTQTVSAIAMQVSLARRLMKNDPTAAEEELYRTEEMARRTTKEIRHMLFTLRPLVLSSEGLRAALNSMADKMQETYDQNVIIEVEEDLVYDLETSVQSVIFNVAEEAVNNARKHAEADHIWVRVKRLKDDLAFLEIADDGRGFDIEDVFDDYESRGSLGMVNMKERAELVRGLFHIESSPQEGTKIQIVIPLSDSAAERLRNL